MHLRRGQANSRVFAHGFEHVVDQALEAGRRIWPGGTGRAFARSTGWPIRATFKIAIDRRLYEGRGSGRADSVIQRGVVTCRKLLAAASHLLRAVSNRQSQPNGPTALDGTSALRSRARRSWTTIKSLRHPVGRDELRRDFRWHRHAIVHGDVTASGSSARRVCSANWRDAAGTASRACPGAMRSTGSATRSTAITARISP